MNRRIKSKIRISKQNCNFRKNMKKNAFGFIAMGIASAVASAQSYIANEDFEGAKPTLEIGAQSRITDAKDEAIGGSRSLLCDAANGKDEAAFEVSSDKFNVFEVSFNYKTLNGAKGAGRLHRQRRKVHRLPQRTPVFSAQRRRHRNVQGALPRTRGAKVHSARLRVGGRSRRVRQR